MTPTIDRTELEDLKARVDLVELFRSHGLEPKKKGKNWLCHCPFHEDREASLSVNPTRRLWNCFGCEAGGDALKFLQLKENLDYGQALLRLQELAGVAPAAPPDKPATLPGGFKKHELLARVAELYHKRFCENPDGQEYLKSRGLSSPELWKAFQVGFCDGTLLSTLPPEGPLLEALQVLGVLNNDKKEHFRGCVVVPLSHPDHGVVGLYGRRIRPDAQNRHLYLSGRHEGVLNWQALRTSSSVLLVESVLDVFSCWMAGERQATCLYGSQGLPEALQELLTRYSVKEVVLAMDGDRAGLECTQKLPATLPQGLQVATVRLPDEQDPNSLLLSQGAEGLQKRLRHRDSQAGTEPSPPRHEITQKGLNLEMDGVRYEIQILPPYTSRLRLSLRGVRGEHFLQDRIDLYLHRDRLKLAKQLMSQLQLSRLDSERHHSEIFRLCEQWLSDRRKREAPPEEGDQKPAMTASEREQALHFLRQPKLARRILADMEELGYVGEEKAKLLVYLIGISRKLPKPLSGIILSQSGCGKSTLTEIIEQLTPPEDVMVFTRITAQALQYMAQFLLKGKLIIVEERTGAESAEYSIRILQSRQKLTQAVPQKDPSTGKISTQIITVEGPVAYLETTTDPKINHENATRCFEITLDESRDQTERIHEAQRMRRLFSGNNLHRQAEEICQRHHIAQRLLEPLLVFIPFADKLIFPSRKLRNRRDHERFLCLIEASAFLHQYQRQRGQTEDGDDYVLADVDDYRVAYELAHEVLAVTLHDLSRSAKELWDQVRAWVWAQAGDQAREFQFSRKELRRLTEMEDHQLRSSLQELVDMEYLEVVSGGNGKAIFYRLLVTTEEEAPMALLTPDELKRRLQQGRSLIQS